MASCNVYLVSTRAQAGTFDIASTTLLHYPCWIEYLPSSPCVSEVYSEMPGAYLHNVK